MTRAYDEWVANLFDVVPGRVVLLTLFLVTLAVSVLWHRYPAWVPRHWPRWRTPSFRRPRAPRFRSAPQDAQQAPAPRRGARPAPADADALAAGGHYDEAIRQRLRDTVRDLTRAGLIAPQPGTTAAELALVAAGNQPAIAPALDAATTLFSEVWYGEQPAGPEQDARMRRLTDEVRTAVGGLR
ncbi:DUF4129 domain-containing protein [Actinoplanes sp. DH11]|uniref:DUF4129 domain-containing protein n=1 Tax=Actinoplanes sp. DH11 TaxID=2857011 RepID=UPI002715123B|nr:DUF4129 domain-containing protein [Actinoplanes sp. DH11]